MNRPERPDETKVLLERSVAFFGAITASVSHELNNVISIINQTAGLLEDLLKAEKEGRPLKTERLDRMARTLKDQTERGIGIIRRLNKFAHSADEAEREYDLNEVAENLVALAGRLANLNNARLELRTADHPLSLLGNPFEFQQAVFLVIRQALSRVHEEDVLLIEVSGQGGGAEISVRGIRQSSTDEFDLRYLEMLMSHMGGALLHQPAGDTMDVTLLIPARR
jgi:C4-dicarboxylate-specific signal transduction histidine kinase